MRLLNTRTLLLHEFSENEVKRLPHAILSHTWLPRKEEVTFEDMQTDEEHYKGKPGYDKIKGCCEQARTELTPIDWVWVDTCCIDQKKETELGQAIRLMWRWYADAAVCYALLADVSGKTPTNSPSFNVAFKNDKYFTRAWTLQELLAPREVIIFSKDWDRIGTRAELRVIVSEATRIDPKVLDGIDTSRLALHRECAGRQIEIAVYPRTLLIVLSAYSMSACPFSMAKIQRKRSLDFKNRL